MLSLTHFLIIELGRRGRLLLQVYCLASETASFAHESNHDDGDNNISMTQSLILRDNRQKARQEVARIVSEACVRATSDIMQVVNNQDLVLPPPMTLFCHRPAVLVTNTSNTITVTNNNYNNYNISNVNTKGENGDDRTMFVTFSKGYPVYEWEVREFFTMTCGDCIESLHMQDVQPKEQSLFARIVFLKASTTDVILNGVYQGQIHHQWEACLDEEIRPETRYQIYGDAAAAAADAISQFAKLLV